MEDFVFRDGYLLRLYSQRGPHAYYRCSNRKNKCKVRLSVNHLSQSENISGEHLDSCVRDITQNPSAVRRRKAPARHQAAGAGVAAANLLQNHFPHHLPIVQPQIAPTLLDNLSLITVPALVPEELRQTADGSSFLQLITAYPNFSVVLFTKEMANFAANCQKLIFESSNSFFPEQFRYLLIIIGFSSPTEIKPIAFILMQECETVELSTLFSFLKGSCNLTNISTIYTGPEATLLNFATTQTQDVRMTFYHLKDLISQNFTPEISEQIFQMALMPRQEAERYIQTLRTDNPESQILSFYDRNLAQRSFEFWNVSEDLEFHKSTSAFLAELKQAMDNAANVNNIEGQNTISNFSRSLQQIEAQFRNFSVTQNVDLIPKSIDDIFGTPHAEQQMPEDGGMIPISKEQNTNSNIVS